MLKKPEDHLLVAALAAPLILGIKALVYYQAGGAGFLSDTGESLVNLFTAGLGAYGAFWARQPRDLDHPYGHGKVDDLVGFAQALVIGGTGLILAYSILQGHYKPLVLEGAAIGWSISTILTNASLAALLWSAYRRFRLLVLRAEAWHLLSDALTTVLVLLSSLGVAHGWPSFLDRIAGLILSILILLGAYRILRRSASRLIDTQEAIYLEQLIRLLEKHRRPNWIDIHNVRIQQYGTKLHIDGHITFPRYWTLTQAHEELKALETTLAQELSKPVEFFWHMDPCEPVCCRYCEVAECTYRQAAFEQRLPYTKEGLFVNQKGLR